MLHIPSLYITHSEERGRGVYTAAKIKKGDLIEVCPLIVILKKDVKKIHKTILHNYYFLMEIPKGSACLALGYGSIYNHHHKPNAIVIFDYESQEMEIQCCKKIKAGEEILIDYTDGGDQDAPLWFKHKS